MAGAKKRKKRATNVSAGSEMVESSPYHYILIGISALGRIFNFRTDVLKCLRWPFVVTNLEDGVRKLNPLAPPTDITKAITEWVSKRAIPLEYDVRMLSDYLQQLLSKNEFESVNFVVEHFQK